MTSGIKTKETGFKQLGKSGIFVCQTRASYEDAIKLLESNGLRRLNLQEALSMLIKNSELMGHLKDTSFPVKVTKVEKDVTYRVDEKGEILLDKNKKTLIDAGGVI